jgi:hypothetical protein
LGLFRPQPQFLGSGLSVLPVQTSLMWPSTLFRHDPFVIADSFMPRQVAVPALTSSPCVLPGRYRSPGFARPSTGQYRPAKDLDETHPLPGPLAPSRGNLRVERLRRPRKAFAESRGLFSCALAPTVPNAAQSARSMHLCANALHHLRLARSFTGDTGYETRTFCPRKPEVMDISVTNGSMRSTRLAPVLRKE